MSRIILNKTSKVKQTYVLFDEDNNKVVCVVDANPQEDVTDRVLLAIEEDITEVSVELLSVTTEFDSCIKVKVTDCDGDSHENEYSLICVAKY